jgi:CRP-like cAMP-binding protein
MEEQTVSLSLLQTFSPLDGLKKENLHALVKKTAVRELPAGRILFKEGDSENRTIYLIKGELELSRDGATLSVLKGGSKEAVNPVSPGVPRSTTARTLTSVNYISIDSDLLDVMLTWDQTGTYEVSELHNDTEAKEHDDWMTTLLQTKAFHKIPPANIQAIFMRMQQVNYKEGDVVIRQGDEGDFFYVITKGKCIVTRETPLNKEGIKLAELKVADTFGEEALISDAKRNATVTMGTDGSLMRLAKDDFNTLLNEPMLRWVDKKKADEIIQQGGVMLDVRLPSEFQNFHKPGAINIPLYFIRMKLSTLDTKKRYVVVCDTGRRSSAAAYIMCERGFDASVLKGGISIDTPSQVVVD